MNVMLLISILVIVLVVFEMFKHVLFKSFSKTILMILLVAVVFFVIVSTLESEKAVQTDSPIIETGAAVVDSVKDEGFAEDIREKYLDIKDSIVEFFS